MRRRKTLIDARREECGDRPKGFAIRRLQEQPIVVATSQASERGWRRPKHLNDTLSNGRMRPCRVCEMLRRGSCLTLSARMNAHGHEAREGWVSDLVAGADLFFEELFVVVLRSETDGWVLGLVGLENDLSRGLRATRSACIDVAPRSAASGAWCWTPVG